MKFSLKFPLLLIGIPQGLYHFFFTQFIQLTYLPLMTATYTDDIVKLCLVNLGCIEKPKAPCYSRKLTQEVAYKVNFTKSVHMTFTLWRVTCGVYHHLVIKPHNKVAAQFGAISFSLAWQMWTWYLWLSQTKTDVPRLSMVLKMWVT